MHWLVFSVLWIVGLAIGDRLWHQHGMTPTWLITFGGIWMLVCSTLRDLVRAMRRRS